MLKTSLVIVSIVTITVAFVTNVYADSVRDHISIVGSSTVYPFSEVVVKRFAKTTNYKMPKIESTGSGFGFKLFCSGIGAKYPDITNASRAIKKAEIEKCKKNGIEEIIEVRIGYDGISIASNKNSVDFKLDRKDIFLALAKEVPGPEGGKKLIPNPYKSWKEVNSHLPNIKIKVLGPPPTSGTRDTFEELVMEGGCKKISVFKKMKNKNKKHYINVCHTIREDGAYIEAGENDNLIVQKLISNPDALGIFGFSFLEQNKDKIKGSSIEGVKPQSESIADGRYLISRPLFFYVKKAHINLVPGIKEYMNEFTSEKALGEKGYLLKRGLIPMPKKERIKYRKDAANLKNML